MIISIKDLVVSGKHGVHDHEKTTPQKFRISVEMDVTTTANLNDELINTVDYSAMARRITAVVENNSYNLIERLAQAIADEVLADSMVKAVTVSVDKPTALKNGIPGVTLQTSRSE